MIDGDETDLNCGGSCPPCDEGQMCGGGADCLTGTCDGVVCLAPYRTSLSISPWAPAMLNAFTFSDGQGPDATDAAGLSDLFERHGGNEIFIRVSTTKDAPGAGVDRSLETGIANAQLAAAMGLPVNIELGLFRTYGEITCQTPPDFSDYPELTTPGPWHTLTLEQMKDAARGYAFLISAAFASTGVDVRMWDIGNEVDFGIAGLSVPPINLVAGTNENPCDGEEGNDSWYQPPDAVNPAIGQMTWIGLAAMPEVDRIAWLSTNLWPHQGELMQAMAEGIRLEVGDANAPVSTHLSGAFITPAFTGAFYSTLEAAGFVVDEYGISYYPSAGTDPDGKLANVQAALTQLHATFGKPTFVAEWGYPSGPPDQAGPYATWNNVVTGYPLNEIGQYELLREFVSWGVTAGVHGVRPFAPELVVAWGPFSFFALQPSGTATAKPAIDAIVDGLLTPDADAL